MRLGQLVRLMPTASKKVLAETLRQLERDGVIVRTDLSDILLGVEYDYAVGFRLACGDSGVVPRGGLAACGF